MTGSLRGGPPDPVTPPCFNGLVMCERIDDLVAGLRRAVSSLDGASLAASDATRLVEVLSEAERLVAAGRTLALGRVVETRAWFDSGSPNPQTWVASRTRGTLGHAAAALQTAWRVRDLPATREALVAGRLSEAQASEIAAASSADPAAERGLLETAERSGLGELRERCREVIAAAASDEERGERIRKGRYLRNWVDRDGAVRLDGRLAPDDGAKVLAAVGARALVLEREARRAGQREPREAHAADALCQLVAGSARTKAVVTVTVDAAAWERGRTEKGETCRIEGVGPVPVATARRLAEEGSTRVLERRGMDVRRVSRLDRTIPAALRAAVEARYPTCVVPDCGRRHGLEIDHAVPREDGGRTTLENLVRLCRFHHAQKTHHGWRLEGTHPGWRWVGPPRGRSPPARAP